MANTTNLVTLDGFNKSFDFTYKTLLNMEDKLTSALNSSAVNIAISIEGLKSSLDLRVSSNSSAIASANSNLSNIISATASALESSLDQKIADTFNGASASLADSGKVGFVGIGTQWFGGDKKFKDSVTSESDMWATAFIAKSSRQYKENIIDTCISALNLIEDTKIVEYNYIGNETKHIGFIAEDTDQILATPNLNGMDYTNCIGVMMKAIQELNEKVKVLEKKLEEKQ